MSICEQQIGSITLDQPSLILIASKAQSIQLSAFNIPSGVIMRLIFYLAIGLLTHVHSHALPLQFLPMPSKEADLGTLGAPVSLSLWSSILLDYLDAVLKGAQVAVEGSDISISKLLQDLHAVHTTPSGVSSFQNAALSHWMNSCVKDKDCKLIKSTDFIKPCYRRGVSLKEILSDYKEKISFINFNSLHIVHPKRLSSVQLSIQLVLLRIMEALSVPTAQEYQDIFGRVLHVVSTLADVLGYILHAGINDIDDSKVYSVDQKTIDEFLLGISSLFNDDVNFAHLSNAFGAHGMAGLFQSNSFISQKFFDYFRDTFGWKLPPATLLRTFKKKFVSPIKFASFLQFFISHTAQLYGINLNLDLSRIRLDVPLELIIGITLDWVRLLYASLQGLVERDILFWMKENKANFNAYIGHLQENDSFMSYPADGFLDTLKCLLHDKRQHQILKKAFLGICDIINALTAPPAMKRATIDRVLSVFDNPEKLDEFFPDSQFIELYNYPERLGSMMFRWLTGQPLKGSISSYIQEAGAKKVLGYFDAFAALTRVFGFREPDFDAIFRFLSPILGSSDHYWNPEMSEKVKAQRVPIWSLQFPSDVDCGKYFQRIWVALIPDRINPRPDIVYLPQSPIQMLQNSASSIAQKANALNKDQIGYIDDFSPVLSLVRFACNLILTLHLQGLVSGKVLAAMNLPHEKYQRHLIDLFNDFSAQEFNGEIGRFLLSMYNGFPQIAGMAGAWRAKREIDFLTRPSEVIFLRSFYASTFLRMLIRTALLCASAAMFFIFIKLCRAPRECRSIVKAIKIE